MIIPELPPTLPPLPVDVDPEKPQNRGMDFVNEEEIARLVAGEASGGLVGGVGDVLVASDEDFAVPGAWTAAEESVEVARPVAVPRREWSVKVRAPRPVRAVPSVEPEKPAVRKVAAKRAELPPEKVRENRPVRAVELPKAVKKAPAKAVEPKAREKVPAKKVAASKPRVGKRMAEPVARETAKTRELSAKPAVPSRRPVSPDSPLLQPTISRGAAARPNRRKPGARRELPLVGTGKKKRARPPRLTRSASRRGAGVSGAWVMFVSAVVSSVLFMLGAIWMQHSAPGFGEGKATAQSVERADRAHSGGAVSKETAPDKTKPHGKEWMAGEPRTGQ